MKKIILACIFLICFTINVKALDEPYLEEIKIDDVVIKDFSKDKTTYNLEVAKTKESVKVSYTLPDNKKVPDDYTVKTTPSITGEVPLKAGEVTKITITLSDAHESNKQTTYTLNIKRPSNQSSNNLLKTLTVDSRRVTLLEDETEYEIHVENSKKKIEVTATPQDLNAKFVTGYGERVGNNAITLNGEKTNFEIKVMAENGKIRTYKITIIKTDYKSNDNKLKSLKINEINFNFKSNIYEYNLEVENEIEKVTLEAVPNYDRATVEYEPSYQLTEGINNIVVKVKAEDGTEKEYKINITRKSLGVLVSNIRIDDIVFDFDPNKYEYEILTSKDTLNFHVTLNKKTATSKILNNTNLKNGSVVRILVQDNDKEIYYNFKISNKDISTTSSNNSNILTTDIAGGGSKFFQKYEMLIGFASLGIGTLGLLIAILTRPKKDKEEDEIIK